jgi:hypothetical protein
VNSLGRRLLPLLLLTLSAGCAALKPERRVALGDEGFRVQRLLVLPVMLPFRTCPEDIDKRARKEELTFSLTSEVVNNLKPRGYTVVPALINPDLLDPKQPFNRDLAQRLCTGGVLAELPASVVENAKSQAKRFKADQVLVGGVARMRWHLKLAVDADNGSVGDHASEFDVRAVAALYDVASGRVVWSEFVDQRFFTGTYEDAVSRVLLFDQVRNRDPHEKLFYDFPLHEGAPPVK